MGKRAEQEPAAIRLYAEGMEIPQISKTSREQGWYVSENTLRKWKDWAGPEWDEARAACRKGFVASMESVGARLMRARELGDALTGDVRTHGRMGLALNQAIQTMIFDLSGQMQTIGIVDPEAMTATIDQLKGLALTLQRTEQAAALNLKREAEIRKQAKEDAAKAVEVEAKRQGASAATIDSLRAAIMQELSA